MLDLPKARAELRQKTKEQIEQETAETWTARAVASYELYRSTKDLSWYRQGVNYEHEAIEHAAESDDLAFLQMIQTALYQARTALGIVC